MSTTSSNIKFSPIGFGLMGLTVNLTMSPNDATDLEIFPVMKESIKRGATFWNGGHFYNPVDAPLANLKLINRYFTKYPEDAKNVTLSIKGCLDRATFGLACKPEEIRKCIDETLETLDGKVHLSIFQCSRIDTSVPLEDIIGTIAEYVKAGKISGIGLSEVSAHTIRRAAAIHPIAAVEVEFSLNSTHILEEGIAKVCGELNIPIIAYSPLGRGLLSGKFKTPKDGAVLGFMMDRFKEENIEHNFKLYTKIKEIADAKKVTAGQIALAWILYQSNKFGNPAIIPIPGTTSLVRLIENTTQITLTEKEFEDLDDFVKKFEVKGGRYNERMRRHLSA